MYKQTGYTTLLTLLITSACSLGFVSLMASETAGVMASKAQFDVKMSEANSMCVFASKESGLMTPICN